jgi:hypothetical protein
MTYALIFLALLFIADTAMTLWAVKHGYKELNKLMVWIVAHPAIAVLTTAVKAAIIVCLIIFLMDNGKDLAAWIAVVIFIAIAVYPIVHNIGSLRKRNA